MLNKAIPELVPCWENAEFNGYDVRRKALICGEDNLKWGNFLTVKDFFKAPLRDLQQYKNLPNECKSMFKRNRVHTL